MNKTIILFFLSIAPTVYGQTQPTPAVDNSNYYKFSNVHANLDWLRPSDAVPIIIDELIKNNLPKWFISVGKLININDSTQLVVTVAFEKGDKEYGFIYTDSHGLPLDPADRNYLTDPTEDDYAQTAFNSENKPSWTRIDPIPGNIFLLKQTCYWFQFDAKGTTFPVSRAIAEQILRQDIRGYLKNL